MNIQIEPEPNMLLVRDAFGTHLWYRTIFPRYLLRKIEEPKKWTEKIASENGQYFSTITFKHFKRTTFWCILIFIS